MEWGNTAVDAIGPATDPLSGTYLEGLESYITGIEPTSTTPGGELALLTQWGDQGGKEPCGLAEGPVEQSVHDALTSPRTPRKTKTS